MSNPVFPALTLTRGGQDSQTYKVALEDVTIKSPIEGGYVVSRARHTRPPRKTFDVSYKSISDADRKTLEAFYGTVRGGSVVFDWTDPVDKQLWQVRFESELTFNYTGVGTTKLWDVSFKVQQA